MNEIPLHSSVLASLRYDPDQQQLRLRFRTEQLYVYRMVPAHTVEEFINAPSHGQYFNSVIRRCFECLRLS